MLYNILADCTLAVHLGLVAFAVLSLLLILIGMPLRWQWVRNLRFRVLHMVIVSVVALEGQFSIRCPLSDLEWALRAWARGEPYQRWNGPTAEVFHGPLQFVAQQDDPDLPAQEEPAAAPADTFVGRMLSAVLFVDLDQEILDRWYVRFGAVTLAAFVGFPPRRGVWSRVGFAGMVLLWIGGLFSLVVNFDYYLTRSTDDHLHALATGALLVAAGAGCALASRRSEARKRRASAGDA